MKFQFFLQNYRGLRKSDFAPEGVCALVGANGSGKSTLFAALEFLRNLYLRPTNSAIHLDGGHWGLRNLAVPVGDDVVLTLVFEQVTWIVILRSGGAANEFLLDERLEIMSIGGGDFILGWSSLSHFQFRGTSHKRGEGSALKLVWEMSEETEEPELKALVQFIRSIRTYRHYALDQLRENGSRVDADLSLSRRGENLFAILRNWRDKRDLRASYDFVIEGLRAAFPDFFDDIEFYGDSQTIRAKVYLQGVPEPMPLTFVPDGLLVAMLHLAAVAGSPGPSFVAIDDFENFLHPFALRSLVESIRNWSDHRDLCVVLATHSPVVLDQFRADPTHVFVMEVDQKEKPIRLDYLRDPEWLSHFSLGDLYSQLEFGARLPAAETKSASKPSRDEKQ